MAYVIKSKIILNYILKRFYSAFSLVKDFDVRNSELKSICKIQLLFIENNSKVLIGWEEWMKSSYPFGSSPNLELWHHHRILKTLIRHYDVICSYIENTYTTLWRHTNLCCLCQMQNTNGLCCLCQNLKYKWLLQEKGSQIQINNKTIIEFGSRRIWGLIRHRFVLPASVFGFGR